jgi:hypothetical protein
MYRFDHMNWLLPVLAGGSGAIAATEGAAQERQVISNQVAVSRSEASLELEFSDGATFSMSFDNGRVTADGEVLGSYESGGAAEAEWRALLSDVLALSNGPLADALQRWEPDPDLTDETDLLHAIDGTLERAVAGVGGAATRSQAGERMGELLEVVARSENVEALGAALEEVDLESLRIWLHRDHTVGEGTSHQGSLLVVGGHLDVRGRVDGDVIVLDGTVTLRDEGEVDGDLLLIQSDLVRRGGQVDGEVLDVMRQLRREENRIREEITAEVAEELGRSRRDRRASGFAKVGRAVGDIIGAGVTFVILGLLTLLLTRVSADRVDVVTRAVGHQPARSAVVGFAGGFLILPVYVLGIVVLAISVVGLPVLLAWLPLFPLAVVVAGFAGYVGVSQQVGRWVLDHDLPWLDWVDGNRPTHLRLLGIATLLAPFVVGSALQLLPLVGWTGSLVNAVGSIACVAAMLTGLGAVIVTRGGRRPVDYEFDDGPYGPADWHEADDTDDAADDGESAGGSDAAPSEGDDR